MNYPTKKTLTLLILLATPSSFVGAQNPAWIHVVANNLLVNLLPLAVAILSAFAVVYFVWGVVLFIAQTSSDQAREDGKQRMFWGIVALFVLVSVWGLVVLLQTIIGVDGTSTPTAPQTAYITLQNNYLS